MIKWRPWPPNQNRKFQVKLVIQSLQGVKNAFFWKEGGGESGKTAPLAAEVRWKGRPRSPLGPLRRSVRRNCTRRVEVLEGAEILEWNEEFYCVCDLACQKDGAFHPWEIAITVFNGLDEGMRNKTSVLGMAYINLAEYVCVAEEEEKIEICIPLHLARAIQESTFCLKLSVSFVELGISDESSELMPKTITLVQLISTSADSTPNDKEGIATMNGSLRKIKTIKRSLSSCKPTRSFHVNGQNDGRLSMRDNDSENHYPCDTYSRDDDVDDGEWGDEKEEPSGQIFCYGTLAAANHVDSSFYIEMSKNGNYDDWVYYSYRLSYLDCLHTCDATTSTTDPSLSSQMLRSILPWKRRKMSIKKAKCKGEPLLKCHREEGGDDIDFDRRVLSSSDKSLLDFCGEVTSSEVSKFGDDDFSVGRWERKEILSRDGKLKMCTDIFFASIDQRNERAAGGSACTALVAVIADWIQTNPHIMPTQSEFNALIREGSLVWQNLCCNSAYQEQFPDGHFDLETVLQAKVRPLSVVPDRSFVGFFHPEGVSSDTPLLEFLNGSLSFENIWDEISQATTLQSPNGAVTLYIVSWNDHFFILKLENEAYYIIDTLGERLYEGCRQAYVLKFDRNSEIQKVATTGENGGGKVKNATSKTSEEDQQVQDASQDQDNHADLDEEEKFLCRGKESCKEYIRCFLAAIPMRELLDDLQKGPMESTPLHQVLQVDFHYTQLEKQAISNDDQSKPIEVIVDSTSLIESHAA